MKYPSRVNQETVCYIRTGVPGLLVGIGNCFGVIVVRVTDKGRSMNNYEQLNKVMVPFGRLRKAGDMQSGTGLGCP